MTMTAERFKAIRQAAGLTNEQTVQLLRMRALDTVRKYSTGEAVVPGPQALIMELLEAGELPARYMPPRRETKPKGLRNVVRVIR